MRRVDLNAFRGAVRLLPTLQGNTFYREGGDYEMTGTRTPESIANNVLQHFIAGNWGDGLEADHEAITEAAVMAAKIAQTPDATDETPEQIAAGLYKGVSDFHVNATGDDLRALLTVGVKAGIQIA